MVPHTKTTIHNAQGARIHLAATVVIEPRPVERAQVATAVTTSIPKKATSASTVI